MRHTLLGVSVLLYLRGAAAVVALAALCFTPARAADAASDAQINARVDVQVDTADVQTVTPAVPDLGIWQSAPTPQSPSSQAQRETASAHGLSRQLLRNEGTDHPGEDQLGTGTSITH